ncbi:MAG: hypothetical protein ACR2LR_27085 [Hassallia sp.]
MSACVNTGHGRKIFEYTYAFMMYVVAFFLVGMIGAIVTSFVPPPFSIILLALIAIPFLISGTGKGD